MGGPGGGGSDWVLGWGKAMPRGSADLSFDRLVERMIQTFVEIDPVGATWLGIHGANDEHLPDRSRAACEREIGLLQGFLAEISAVRERDLSPDRAIDCRLARGALSAKILRFQKHPPWRESPCFYVEPIAYGLYSLLAREFAPPARRAQALLGRLREVCAVLAAARSNLENPPAVFTETSGLATRGLRNFIATSVDRFISSVRDPRLRASLEGASSLAQAALSVHQDWLETDLMSRSKKEFAVGRQLYERLLAEEHSLAWGVDDLIAIGQHVHRETMREIKRVAARIDSAGPWSAVVERLKLSHPPQGSILKAYESEMARARGFLRKKGIATLPEGESVRVLPTPEFARPTYPYAAYLGPAPFETDQTGTLWVTEPDPGADLVHREAQAKGHASFRIPILVLHETYPGHHLQQVQSNLVKGHHLRHIFRSNSNTEGWALYCEGMMREQGYLADDRALLFQLKDLLWRTCRIIVDVQLHTGNMGFNEAVQFLVKKAHLERPNAVAEVRRYCANPTQPMSYLIGMIQIKELLEDCKASTGAGFDLRKFHDDFLSAGAIPIELVRAAMGVERRKSSQNGRKRGSSPLGLVKGLDLLRTKGR